MAGKVRMRGVLQPRKSVIDYTYDFGDQWEHRLTVTDVRLVSRGSPIRGTLAAKETGRPRIAVEFRASTNGLQRFQTPPTRAMRRPKNGRMITIQTQSMSCRLITPSVASRTGATLPRRVLPARNSPLSPTQNQQLRVMT